MLKRKNYLLETPFQDSACKKIKTEDCDVGVISTPESNNLLNPNSGIEKEVANILCSMGNDKDYENKAKMRFNLMKVKRALHILSRLFSIKKCYFFHKDINQHIYFRGNKYTIIHDFLPFFITKYPSIVMLLSSDVKDIEFIFLLEKIIFESGDCMLKILYK